MRHTHKQEMELWTCACTSFHFCQLFTDHWRGRTSFLSSEIIILFYFILFYFILFYFILFYFILSYFILFYLILFYISIFYFLFHFILLFYLFILSYELLFYNITIPVICNQFNLLYEMRNNICNIFKCFCLYIQVYPCTAATTGQTFVTVCWDCPGYFR